MFNGTTVAAGNLSDDEMHEMLLAVERILVVIDGGMPPSQLAVPSRLKRIEAFAARLPQSVGDEVVRIVADIRAAFASGAVPAKPTVESLRSLRRSLAERYDELFAISSNDL